MSKVATECLRVYNEIQYYIGNIHGLHCSMAGYIVCIHGLHMYIVQVYMIKTVVILVLIQCINGHPQIVHCTHEQSRV